MKKILDNEYISTTIGKFASIIGTVVTTALLNRYLGPKLRGEYALVINQLILIVGIVNLGLPNIYHYFYRKSSEYSLIFKNLVFFQFIFLIVINSLLILFFDLSSEVRVILFLVPFVVIAQQVNIMALIHNINKRNRNNISVAFISVILWIIVVLFTKENIIYAYGIYGLKELIISIKSLKIIKFDITNFKIDIKKWMEILRVAFLPMVTLLLNTMNYRIDTIILGYNVEPYQLGLYSAGLSIAEIAWVVPDIFKEIMFNKSAKDDSIEVVIKSIRITLLINLFIIISVIIFGKLIILILMGRAYQESYSIIILLFLGIPSMSFFKIINPLYLANGNRVFSCKILFYSVITNILFNLILIPFYGIYGAAFSSVVSYSLCGIIFLLSFSKKYDINVKDLLIVKKDDYTMIKKNIEKYIQ